MTTEDQKSIEIVCIWTQFLIGGSWHKITLGGHYHMLAINLGPIAIIIRLP